MAGTLSGSTVVTGTIVYACDLETRIEFPVVTGPGVHLLPGVWGNVVIWMQQDGDDAYICGYDPLLEERFAIATVGASSGSTPEASVGVGSGDSPGSEDGGGSRPDGRAVGGAASVWVLPGTPSAGTGVVAWSPQAPSRAARKSMTPITLRIRRDRRISFSLNSMNLSQQAHTSKTLGGCLWFPISGRDA